MNIDESWCQETYQKVHKYINDHPNRQITESTTSASIDDVRSSGNTHFAYEAHLGYDAGFG